MPKNDHPGEEVIEFWFALFRIPRVVNFFIEFCQRTMDNVIRLS
jgi:hypothetical protein